MSWSAQNSYREALGIETPAQIPSEAISTEESPLANTGVLPLLGLYQWGQVRDGILCVVFQNVGQIQTA